MTTATDYKHRAAQEYRDLRRTGTDAQALATVAARYGVSEKTLHCRTKNEERPMNAFFQTGKARTDELSDLESEHGCTAFTNGAFVVVRIGEPRFQSEIGLPRS